MNFLALATLFAIVGFTGTTAIALPAGVYSISHPDQLLTLESGDAGAPVLALFPNGIPGEQEWQVELVSDATVTIRNIKFGTFLSYDGEPSVNNPVIGLPEAREWRLFPSAEPTAFFIVAGPNADLAIDLSLLRIFPIRTALRPLRLADASQAWNLRFLE